MGAVLTEDMLAMLHGAWWYPCIGHNRAGAVNTRDQAHGTTEQVHLAQESKTFGTIEQVHSMQLSKGMPVCVGEWVGETGCQS